MNLFILDIHVYTFYLAFNSCLKYSFQLLFERHLTGSLVNLHNARFDLIDSLDTKMERKDVASPVTSVF